MSHVLAFVAGAFAMLATMIYAVEYPITIRRKRKPKPDEPDPGGGWQA